VGMHTRVTIVKSTPNYKKATISNGKRQIQFRFYKYVDEAIHWRYSSARDYEGVNGLVEVERFL